MLLFVTVGILGAGWALLSSRWHIPVADCEQKIAALGEAIRRQAQAIAELERETETLRELTERQAATIKTVSELLYEKQGETRALQTRITELEAELLSIRPSIRKEEGDIYVLIAIGPASFLARDIVSFRRIKARKSNFSYTRLSPVTKRKLIDKLARDRLGGHPIQYLHFAVESASDGGLVFEDGIASPDWLSENVRGVRVALIAGCKTDRVGDYIGVAEAVITLLEEVENENAAQFSEAFWSAIADLKSPRDAYEFAVETCPDVGEFSEYH